MILSWLAESATWLVGLGIAFSSGITLCASAKMWFWITVGKVDAPPKLVIEP